MYIGTTFIFILKASVTSHFLHFEKKVFHQFFTLFWYFSPMVAQQINLPNLPYSIPTFWSLMIRSGQKSTCHNVSRCTKHSPNAKYLTILECKYSTEGTLLSATTTIQKKYNSAQCWKRLPWNQQCNVCSSEDSS